MILRLAELSKEFRHPWTYRRLPVLQDVSLHLDEGEIFGLIGPNGAGKTTTFKCLLGFLRPTAGTVEFLGGPLTPASRRHIGFLPEQPYFYDHLTVAETLDFYGRLYGMSGSSLRSRIRELAAELKFDPKLDAPLRTLSKGNLQRVGVAQAILHRPRLVILDEPMSGLDPNGRKQLRDLILALREAGTTIIFSSHILPDAEALCDRVGILVSGKLREILPLKTNATSAGYRVAVTGANAELLQTLGAMGKRSGAAGAAATFVFHDYGLVRRAIEAIHAAGARLDALTPASPSLEERFLAHVGQLDQTD